MKEHEVLKAGNLCRSADRPMTWLPWKRRPKLNPSLDPAAFLAQSDVIRWQDLV